MSGLNLHHVGIWVDDVDEMVTFLTDVLGFRVLMRPTFEWGERVSVHLGGAQFLEVLSQPGMQARPALPAYMAAGTDPVVGIPHVCLRVTDLAALEETIRSRGYRINHRLPDQGYELFEFGSLRALFVTGPGGVDFELLEFEDEYPIDSLPRPSTT